MTRSRNRGSLTRPTPRREPYDRVLIVCEGSKTEPNYLKELVAHYRLSSANIQITGEGGAAPNSVVGYAIELFEKDPDYDRVYCVFDRDGHPTFHAAVQQVQDKRLIRRSGRKKIGEAHFEAITSIPCFEYWVLLHFRDTTAHMSRFADLLPYMRKVPELCMYDKGARGLFGVTHAQLYAALDRADRANRAAEAACTDNPTTRMPELIRYLLQLANKKSR